MVTEGIFVVILFYRLFSFLYSLTNFFAASILSALLSDCSIKSTKVLNSCLHTLKTSPRSHEKLARLSSVNRLTTSNKKDLPYDRSLYAYRAVRIGWKFLANPLIFE